MLQTLLTVFLFAPPVDAGGAQPNPLLQIVPLVLIFIVFYFFMIRPQQKKQKEREKTLDSLQKGDKVVTIGGIHGTVVTLDQTKKTVLVQVSDNTKILFDRSAIASSDKRETADKLITQE